MTKPINIDLNLIIRCWGCYGVLEGGQIQTTVPDSTPEIGIMPCKTCMQQAISDSLSKATGIK
jgi:hypothetical protein